MRRLRSRPQRGQTLLLMLLILAMGSTWYLVSRLNAESGAATAYRKQRNADILNRAKQALIGYIGAQAIKAGENRPGAFPCPEAPGYFDSTTQDGQTASACTPPVVGRFPWRTIGTDKLVDVTGEPLWYVVASGWSGSNTVINSDCASPGTVSPVTGTGLACSSPGGRLSVDGVTGDVIAIIIAPGPAVTVPAVAGCAARTQTHPSAAPPDLRNYLECENASSPVDATFVTTSTNSAFNDQIITITVGDVMPVIEAAIAKRIEREIAPALATVYTPAGWGFSGANAVYPYAATFANPGPGTGTSPYQGAAATYRGLLPFNLTNCTVSSSNPRCSNSFLSFSKYSADTFTGDGGIHTQSNCSWSSNIYVCTGQYDKAAVGTNTTQVSLHLRIANVAMGLRKLDSSQVTCTAVDDAGGGIPQQTVNCTVSAVLQSDGSAILTITTATLPDVVSSGWNNWANYTFNVGRTTLGDHALLDTADATTGWFARNEWFRTVYYAVAQSNTALRLPLERSCSTAGDCLSVANLIPSTKTALLVLAGRSLNGSVRPSTNPLPIFDYLEFGNANAANGGAGAVYESRTVSGKPTSLYVDTGSANAYAVVPISSLSTGATFQFQATNSNTGASTLSTSATGSRPLVNGDGSALAASTIAANGAVQVTWDGTKFLLSKRPFNDRIVAVSSN